MPHYDSTSTACIYEITADGQEVQAEDDWLDGLAEGKVVVVKQALQKLEMMEEVRRLSLAAISEITDPSVAETIAANGFEVLHQYLTGEQIAAVYRQITKSLQGTEQTLGNRLVSRLLNEMGGHKGHCYLSSKVWVRFFVPHDCYQRNQKLFSKRVGHLALQNPHKDSWFTNPHNAIVIWIAISEVVPGNGMLIYPEQWSEDIPRKNFHQNGFLIDRKVRPGSAINFNLQAGDLLLFSGEHLHSSELNRTDKTRFVISYRYTLTPPDYGEGDRWKVYQDTRLLGTLFKSLAGFRSMLTPAFLRFLLFRRLAYWLKIMVKHLLSYFIVRHSFNKLSEVTSTDDKAVSVLSQSVKLANAKIALFKVAQDLIEGEVHVVDENYCATQSQQRTILFSRYCPHRAADLAGGTIQAGKIYCPWHNLSFDLVSGKQPCKSLSDLQVWSEPIEKSVNTPLLS